MFRSLSSVSRIPWSQQGLTAFTEVLVKGLDSSYQNKETILLAIDPYYGSLNKHTVGFWFRAEGVGFGY